VCDRERQPRGKRSTLKHIGHLFSSGRGAGMLWGIVESDCVCEREREMCIYR
jgi:hypothetical protein